MSELDAAVEAFVQGLARELAQRVDVHLERLLAERQHERHAVTLAEAARRLGTSERNVRRMVADGRLASVKMGRVRRVPSSAVASLLETTTPAPLEPGPVLKSVRRGA